MIRKLNDVIESHKFDSIEMDDELSCNIYVEDQGFCTIFSSSQGYGGSNLDLDATKAAKSILFAAKKSTLKRKYLSKILNTTYLLLSNSFNAQLKLQIFSLFYLDELFLSELGEYFCLSINDLMEDLDSFIHVINLVDLFVKDQDYIYLLRPDGTKREIIGTKTIQSIGLLLNKLKKSVDFYTKNNTILSENVNSALDIDPSIYSQLTSVSNQLKSLSYMFDVSAKLFLEKRIRTENFQLLSNSIEPFNSKTCNENLNSVEELNNLDFENRNKAKEILKSVQFATTKLAGDNVKFPHTFSWLLKADELKVISKGRISRIKKEMSSLLDNMPWGIYLRLDENRYDLIRFMITGPVDTPYSLGLFLFDAYLPPEYPQVPPRVNFLTTGNGECRLNPNLYDCGKVCLSLLGTWEGPGWCPQVSTFLQVLLSIQAMIFNDHPLLNEPGFEYLINTPVENKYHNYLNSATLLYACNWQIAYPPESFELCIKAHFYYYKNYLLLFQIPKWLDGVAIQNINNRGLEISNDSEICDNTDEYDDYISQSQVTQFTIDEIAAKVCKQLSDINLD